MRKLLFFLLGCYISVSVHAQGTPVKGKVTDENGGPLVGAVVKVKGGSAASSTNNNGEYAITVASGAVLTFSFVGYTTKELPVGESRTINVSLSETDKSLEEVVVVGYGTQKKTSLTGSVASVSNKEITTTKNQNVQNMLTGKVPGLRVVQGTSEPGTFNNQFDIRGFGNNPLVIIDGVPRGNLSRLDPNEIESVSVLKDASAAIYGARAANGVIVVTTKKGAMGKASIEYSVFAGFQRPSGLPKPLNAVDRFTILNERSMHNINSPVPAFSDDVIRPFLDGTRQSTDWYDMVMRKSSGQSQHNLSASGSAEGGKISYFMNFGYSAQSGLWKSDDLNYKKYNFRSNVTAQVTRSLKATLNLSGIMDEQNRPYRDSWEIFKNLWRSHPDDPYYANNNPAYLFKNQADYNPGAIADSDISGFRKYNNKIFQSSFSLDYAVPFVKGLSARGLFSYDANLTDNTSYQKTFSVYDYNPTNNSYTGVKYQIPNQLNRSYSTTPNNLLQFSLNYERTFAGKHDLKLFGAYEEENNSGDAFQAQRELSIQLPYLFAGNSLNQQGFNNPADVFQTSRKAFIGRINYAYSSKYLLEFAVRRDGSSKFPPSDKWGFFPSGSLGWRISEEGFIKNNSALSFIDNIKLRASYGVVGNDSGLNFQHVQGYDYPATGNSQGLSNGYFFDGWTNSLGFRVLPTPNFTWYEGKMLNFGLDGEFWKGKFGFSFDAFQRNGSGIAANRSVSFPATFGAVTGLENLNSDQTRGLELLLTHRNTIGKELNYSLSGNINITRTKNRYVERGRDGNSYLNWRNNTTNRYNDVWFGYGYVGQYQSNSEIVRYPVYTSRVTLPGDYIYEDWNGDGTIDDMDRYPIATTLNPTGDFNSKQNNPLLTFGLNISADYKGFDLNVLLQGAGMSYVAYGEMYQTISENALDFFMDRWHPQDPKKDPYDPSNVWIPGYNAYSGTQYEIDSKRGIQNGYYLRVKSIELGYSLPKKLISKAGLQQVRFYANGYNLFTFTNAIGVDPEHPSNIYGYLYPLNKTVNFGANIKF
ncbi:TonB-dependent receptor [Pedobacter jeongneungensis]|uniref:TonB-dependent receptor n=1 Tax=Pedobacter jeongneungensis TaxID=947309 RepID=A0ABP8B7G6_9SPHI